MQAKSRSSDVTSLIDWLDEPWTDVLPFASPSPWLPLSPTRMNILCALIGMNDGKADVEKWEVEEAGGIYGKRGLSQNEAFALMVLASFVDGWLAATKGAEREELHARIAAEWNHVRALNSSISSADTKIIQRPSKQQIEEILRRAKKPSNNNHESIVPRQKFVLITAVAEEISYFTGIDSPDTEDRETARMFDTRAEAESVQAELLKRADEDPEKVGLWYTVEEVI